VRGAGDGSGCYSIPLFPTRYLSAGKRQSSAGTAASHQNPALAPGTLAHAVFWKRTRGQGGCPPRFPVPGATGRGHCWREAQRSPRPLQRDGGRPGRGMEKLPAAGPAAAFYLCCAKPPAWPFSTDTNNPRAWHRRLGWRASTRGRLRATARGSGEAAAPQPLGVPSTAELPREHPLFQLPRPPRWFGDGGLPRGPARPGKAEQHGCPPGEGRGDARGSRGPIQASASRGESPALSPAQ